jgi:hypothetical protein
VRISLVENLRFPEEGSSAQGKSGPKTRLRSVADGQLVDIPIPPMDVNTEVVTQKDRMCELME